VEQKRLLDAPYVWASKKLFIDKKGQKEVFHMKPINFLKFISLFFIFNLVNLTGLSAAPVVNAGQNQTVFQGTEVILTAAASDNAGLAIVDYTWRKIRGDNVSLNGSKTPRLRFTAPSMAVGEADKELLFRIIVTNSAGETSRDFIKVIVKASSLVVNAGPRKTILQNTPVSLTAVTNDDNGATIVDYNWWQISGENVTLTNRRTETVSFTTPAMTAGEADKELTFRIIVTNSLNETATDFIKVIVKATNVAPTVNAGSDLAVDAESLVNLLADAVDSDDHIVSYRWSQLSGDSVSLTNSGRPSLSFTAPSMAVGEADKLLVFRVRVKDNLGESTSDIVNVTVKAPADTIIAQDDFESGALAAPLWNASTNTSVESIDLGGRQTNALQFLYAGVPSEVDSTAEQRFDLGQQYENVSIRFDLYIPLNYEHRNEFPANNKLFRLWTTDHSLASYGHIEKVGASLMPGVDGSRLGIDYSRASNLQISTGVGGTEAGFISNDDKGQWMEVIIDVKSSNASEPGFIRIYKNGVLFIERVQDNDYDNSILGYRVGYLLGWANSGFTNNTYLYIDNIEFHDEVYVSN